jgi:hypothetical protein
MTWAATPAEGELATFDARVADAARLEGFKALSKPPVSPVGPSAADVV